MEIRFVKSLRNPTLKGYEKQFENSERQLSLIDLFKLKIKIINKIQEIHPTIHFTFWQSLISLQIKIFSNFICITADTVTYFPPLVSEIGTQVQIKAMISNINLCNLSILK